MFVQEASMSIRAAKLDDVASISQLIIPLVDKFILPDCSEQGARLLLESMSRSSIEGYFEKGIVYYVAEVSYEIIAVIGMKDNAHLYHLFVAESQQGKGFANELWQYAKKRCEQKGNLTGFTVNASLNAATMYKKWGFVATSGVRQRSGIKDVPMVLAAAFKS